MSELVVREITKGVWTFSRPFARFGVLPVGGRSTAIQLEKGGVWILASTPLDQETKTSLDKLGPVKYIIGANAVHHLFLVYPNFTASPINLGRVKQSNENPLGDYKKAYPTAKLIVPEATIARHGDKDLTFDGVWGRDPPNTTYGFEDELDSCYFSGFKNKDVAFLHKPSKSLIEADLLMNLPCNEQYSKTKSSNMFLGMGFGPSSWMHSKVTQSLGIDKAAMRRDVKTVAGWNFERIIPCHGDVIELNAQQAWKDIFKSFVD